MKKFLALAAIALFPTLLVWLPFFVRVKNFWGIPLPQSGMATLVANFDGPLYLVIAKSFYNPGFIKLNFQFPLPVEYYAAHFPLFPVLIKIASFAIGFPYAMLLISLLSSILACYFFYQLIRQYLDERSSLFVTCVFSILPARWIVVHSVGSAEPLFLASIIASIFFFQKKNYLKSGLWGLIAQLTKPPAILLFVAYLGIILAGKLKKSTQFKLKEIWAIFLIPLALLAVFLIFKIRLNDFFAYFHSGDNIHLTFPPFSIFNYSSPWVGTFWLEEVIFVYLFGILGLLRLIKQKENILAWFVGVFFFSLIFVAHRDLIRYALPITPFILIAFRETVISKEFKIALLILAVPIYLFTLTYISQNVMPISNWAPFL
jgi:Gpi18-like mannosyltransferase